MTGGSMRQYLAVTKGTFMAFSAYRYGFYITFVGNLVYIGVVYFLWRSIYKSASTLRGMTFDQAFLYLTLAGTLFILFKTYTDWEISSRILNGSIIVNLIKPLDLQLQLLCDAVGVALASLCFVTLPSLLALVLLFDVPIVTGQAMVFLPLALAMAFLLSYTLDYIVGLTAFYTESLWGIS